MNYVAQQPREPARALAGLFSPAPVPNHVLAGVFRPLLVLAVLCICVPAAIRAAEPSRGAEIHPPLELLAGVLAHTDWMKQRGPVSGGNSYFRELKAVFQPHKEHQAVQLAQQLVRKGFTYDAHARFAMCLGPLPELALATPYPPELLERFRGDSRGLEAFRLALRDIARVSDFNGFVERHSADYERWCAAAQFNRAGATQRLEDFFGENNNEFRMILAPAMFPNGGYGVTFPRQDKPTLVCQIIRADARGNADPIFPSGRELELLALHEWGHSFVNPAIERHAASLTKLEPHFARVKDVMTSQAYPSLPIYANEQVLRAFVLLAATEIAPEHAKRLLRNEEQRGFLLTRAAARELRRYAANREAYRKFGDFVPELLARLAEEPVRGVGDPTSSAGTSNK